MPSRSLILGLSWVIVLNSGCEQSDCILYPDTRSPNGQQCSWSDLSPKELFWPEATNLTLELDETLLNSALRDGAAAAVRIRERGSGASVDLTGCGSQLSPLPGLEAELPRFRVVFPRTPLLSEKLGSVDLEITAEGRSARSSLIVRGPYDRTPAIVSFTLPAIEDLLFWGGFVPGEQTGQFAFAFLTPKEMFPTRTSVGSCTLTELISRDYRCSDATDTQLAFISRDTPLIAVGKESLVFARTFTNLTELIQFTQTESTLAPRAFFTPTRLAMDRNDDMILVSGLDKGSPSFWAYSVSRKNSLNVSIPPELNLGLQSMVVGDIDSDGLSDAILLRDYQGVQRVELVSGMRTDPIWSWNQGRSDELSALLAAKAPKLVGAAMAVDDVDGDQQNELLLLGSVPPSNPGESEQWMLAMLQKATAPCSVPLVLIKLEPPRTSVGKLLDLSVGHLSSTKTLEIVLTTGARRSDGTLEKPEFHLYRYKAP